MKNYFLHTFKSFERVNPCAQVRLCAACVGVCVCARVCVKTEKGKKEKEREKERGRKHPKRLGKNKNSVCAPKCVVQTKWWAPPTSLFRSGSRTSSGET